jgi:FKBP-type peptidyl-prolyl cis-trans isomerase
LLSTRGRSLALGAGLALLLLAPQGAAEVKPEKSLPQGSFASEDARAAYALGVVAARGFSFLGFSEEEYAQFLQGIKDERAGSPKVALPRELERVETFQQQRTQSRVKRETALEKSFLEEAARRPKVEKLTYGVLFEPLEAGKGDPPKLQDTLTIDFATYLPDGSLVDSSELRGGSQRFPFARIAIPCWSQALQQMRPGAKARLSCPALAAYGEQGLPPLIPPGSAVRVDLTLVSVEKATSFEGIHGRPQGGSH